MVQQLVLHGILHPMLRSCLLLDLLTVVDVYFHSPFAFEDVVQFFLSGFATGWYLGVTTIWKFIVGV